MNMRSSAAPFGGAAQATDFRIGDAFPIIEAVYKNLDKLKYIAENAQNFVLEQIEFRSNIELEAIEWRYTNYDWQVLCSFDELTGVDLDRIEETMLSLQEAVQDDRRLTEEAKNQVQEIKRYLDTLQQAVIDDTTALVQRAETALQNVDAKEAAVTQKHTEVLDTALNVQNDKNAVEAAKNAAELARDAALAAAGPLYATIEEGRAAVADGETFAIQGDGEYIAAAIYRRTSPSESTKLTDILAGEQFNKRITKASSVPTIIPLVTGKDENGIERILIGILQNGDIVFAGSISRSDANNLFVSKQFASDTYLQKLDAELLYEPLNKTIPIATDGRTLNQWRRKLALVKNSVAGEKLRVMMIGDSWSELPTIPTALKSYIEQSTGKTAHGCFAQANGTANLQWPGVSSSVSGAWVRQDASVNSDWPYGTGPDGQNWYSSEVGAKLTVSGVKGHSLRIYTRRNGGSFRYSIDGSAWTTVTQSASDKSLEITAITGLTDTTHQVEIEVISGLVNYCGILNETSDPVQIIKVGNAGHTGYRMRDYIENVSDILSDTSPDIVLVTLGTNDYRNGVSTVSTFVEGITKLINSIRSFSTTAGIVLIFPAKTNGSAQRPLLNYLAPAYDLAKQKNIEMLNLFDSWGEYADGAGLWADSLHVNSNGATVIVGQFSQKFGA